MCVNECANECVCVCVCVGVGGSGLRHKVTSSHMHIYMYSVLQAQLDSSERNTKEHVCMLQHIQLQALSVHKVVAVHVFVKFYESKQVIIQAIEKPISWPPWLVNVLPRPLQLTPLNIHTAKHSLFGDGQLAVDLVLHIVAQQFVIEVDRHSILRHCEHLHGILHTIKGGGLPHKVHLEWSRELMWDTHVGLEL